MYVPTFKFTLDYLNEENIVFNSLFYIYLKYLVYIRNHIF